MSIQIDPTKISKQFDLSDEELVAYWWFCIMVAGRNADMVAKKLNTLLAAIPKPWSAKGYAKRYWLEFEAMLYDHKIGQYDRIATAISSSLDLDLRNCTLEDLLKVHGVGPKTARFFLLHTRKDAEYIVLDTHVMQYLRDKWYCKILPDGTPDSKLYDKLEKMAIKMVKTDFPKLTLSEIDLKIWMMQSGRETKLQKENEKKRRLDRKTKEALSLV